MLVIKHSEGQLQVQFCLPALIQGNMKRNDMFVLFFAAPGDIRTWQRHSLLRPIASTVRIQTADLAHLTLQLTCCACCSIRNGARFYTAEYQWRRRVAVQGTDIVRQVSPRSMRIGVRGYSADCGIQPVVVYNINPLNAELNRICYLLALLGAHHILHVSSIKVKIDTHTAVNRNKVSSKNCLY